MMNLICGQWVNFKLLMISQVYSMELEKSFPLTVGGEAFAIQARTGSNIVVRDTIILTINDVLTSTW